MPDPASIPPSARGIIKTITYLPSTSVLLNDSDVASGATTSTSFVDALNYTGSGYVSMVVNKNAGGAGTANTVEILIDGVSITTSVGPGAVGATWYGPLIGYWHPTYAGAAKSFNAPSSQVVVFATSLQIRHKLNSADGTAGSTVLYQYVKSS